LVREKERKKGKREREFIYSKQTIKSI